MKKIVVFSFLILILSCKVTEKPEFIKVESVKVIQANKNGIKVKTDLLFLNKNRVGGTLQANDIKVLLDSVEVATINSDSFKVPKKEKFVMPLIVTIPYNKVFKDNKQNLLAGIMNMIRNKKIVLTYKGQITYSLGVFTYNYPLNYTQETTIR